MTAGTQAASGAFAVSAHAVTVTADDTAFPCLVGDRVTGRTQTILRGTLTVKAYKTNGNTCDLAKLTSRFPLGRYRVLVGLDATATYYGVYDHTAKKLKVFSALSTQVANGTVLNKTFGFTAVGE